MNYQPKIQSLLETLPHKLQVRYALNIANDAKHLMKNESLECLKVIELWLQDKATIEEVKIARDAAWASANAAYYTANACAAIAVFAADSAAVAANAVYWTATTLSVDIKIYHDKLVEFINNLTSTEKIIYNINNEL